MAAPRLSAAAFKRFRKYNAGAIAGTQQIVDVLDAADNLGAAIIENSHTKVFFGLGTAASSTSTIC